MTINNEIFTSRPLGFEIPNAGVANVNVPTDAKQWEVLNYELARFVCEGEYEVGLERILASYISHRNDTVQPAIWVSGFYGSGKSHLVRVLQHLWADTKIPGGATARGLVNVSPEIRENLIELTTISKRDGAPPWSAAGSLDQGGDFLNAIFLGIVLGAAGLPPRIGPAQVALWLAGNGNLDTVRSHVEKAGGDFIEEIGEYHVSTILADAIIAADPDFASSGADVRNALRSQFPPEAETLSTQDTIALLRKILRYVGGGVIPATLIVLDEVQEYINSGDGHSAQVRLLVEAVSRELDGRVLLIATGQQELTADAALQRIQDRFSTVKVILKNQDVDAVVRRVLLNKEPAKLSELESKLAEVSGPISRQLAGSKIQHSAQDDKDLVADYPLLPARRRFWESVLRQADAGRAGQLRSQLRIVHEANRAVAEKPIGIVVGADFLYKDKNDDLNGAGLLLKETQRLIHEQGQQDPLRGRVLGLIHLISLLPTSGPGDIGVRATADHLVDLLVEDLAHDGAALRQEMPGVLAALAEEGILQQDGDEYRLQTSAGRAWDEAFRRHHAQITDSEVGTTRDVLLRGEVEKALPASVLQGRSKVARRLALDTDASAPQTTDTIPVWLRSEWDDGTSAKLFEDLARGLGVDSSVVLLHLPRLQAQAFASALRSQMAAQRVLDQQGFPQDDEGKQARRAMETRLSRSQAQVRDLATEILSKASVQLGGGAIPSGTALRDRIENAAQSAATRLFAKFDVADDARWPQVIDRIKKGSGADALKVLGYDADPDQHPVVREVLGRIGGASTAANDVERAVLSHPFGWPRDALMGAIGILLDNGLIRATINGSEATAAQILSQTRLGTVNLRRESTVLKAAEKVAARSLLNKLGVQADNENLAQAAEQAVNELVSRAELISGPAPLPEVAVPAVIQQIKGVSGNERVHALLAAKTELTEFGELLEKLQGRRSARLNILETARGLSAAAIGLEEASEARARLESFENTRELLAETDQISPVMAELASAVRAALNEAAEKVEQARQLAVDGLQRQAAWSALEDTAQAQILADKNLSSEEKPELGDPDAVLQAVQLRPLSAWSAVIDAVPARAAKALEEAVRVSAPTPGTVTVPVRVLNSKEEIEPYIADLETTLNRAFETYETVVVKG